MSRIIPFVVNKHCDIATLAFAAALDISVSSYCLRAEYRGIGVWYMLPQPCLSEIHDAALSLLLLCIPERSKLIHFICRQSDISHQCRGKTWPVLPLPVPLSFSCPTFTVFLESFCLLYLAFGNLSHLLLFVNNSFVSIVTNHSRCCKLSEI